MCDHMVKEWRYENCRPSTMGAINQPAAGPSQDRGLLSGILTVASSNGSIPLRGPYHTAGFITTPFSSSEHPVRVLSVQGWIDLGGFLLLNGSDQTQLKQFKAKIMCGPTPIPSALGGIELWLLWAPYLIALENICFL